MNPRSVMNFDEIKPGAKVHGLQIGSIADVVQVTHFGSDAIQVTFRVDGRVGERVLFRGDETTLSLAETGRAYGYDADGSLHRLASEAYRIRLAHSSPGKNIALDRELAVLRVKVVDLSQGLGHVLGNRTFQETALVISKRVPARMPRRKMGQEPALEVMKTTLRFEPAVMAHLKAVAGLGGVAAFLHEAVLEKLERQAGSQNKKADPKAGQV